LPTETYIPYVATSSIVWSYYTSTMMEATSAFPASASYLLNQRLPYSFVIYACVFRNFLVFLHHLPIIVVVLLYFGVHLDLNSAIALLGLAAGTFCVFLVSYVIAVFCARFRDLSQIVSSILTVAFFVTPVMWMPELMPERAAWVTEYNPLASMLAIVRDPLLGRPTDILDWYRVGALALLLTVLVPLVAGFGRRRLIYWM